ncbi:MAG: M36 family metallopeptidase [Nocardioidaceae bacterium]|nr:M36 family metallopeptidase [Nocardioidaceae bacterium]
MRSISSLTASITVGFLTAAALTGAPATASTAPTTSVATAAPRVITATELPADLRLVRTTRSLLGTHTWYEQTVGGRPVVGGWYVVHRALDGTTTVGDGRIPAERLVLPSGAQRRPFVPVRAAVTAVTARPGAPTYLEASSEGMWVLPADGDRAARYVYAVLTVNGHGSTRHYVDAASAQVLVSDKISQHAAPRRKGKARVFDPNPVVKLQDEELRDQKDANAAVPASAYRRVTIRHLHHNTLVGKWVEIINRDRPVRPGGDFRFGRANNRFEMVNAYYGVERVQGFLQSLGFTDANAERQRVKTDAFAFDNSFYEPGSDRILFGRGGVDDAEDLEVVWHEYGHAVQDAQVPGFGSREQAGAIGEGFGDYLAVTMSQRLSPDTATTPWACVMDWDATSYTTETPHCLRRVDGTKVFPDDLDGEVHDDGEIWSRALWDINQAVGRRPATTLIIEAQFSFTPGIGFQAAAQTTVDTARALYGDTVAGQVQTAFVDRGILAS